MKLLRLCEYLAIFASTLVPSWLVPSQVIAADKPMIPVREQAAEPRTKLSGNLRVDLFGLEQLPTHGQAMQQPASQAGSKRSPWLAAGMSLIVPGAGEFYAESYWKTAAFFAVEVATWAIAYTYDKKGNRQTDFFQGIADAHWSVNRYAQWTLDNGNAINSAVDLAPYKDPATGVIVNGRVNWAKLNQLESALGNWYSHNLPAYGEQQYYELIGKYEQFYEGWDDANYSLPGYYDVAKANLSPRNQSYAVDRGKANDYYTTASTFVSIAIVNHILSAIDAAWSAGSYNRVHAEVGLQTVPVRGYYAQVPVVKISYGF